MSQDLFAAFSEEREVTTVSPSKSPISTLEIATPVSISYAQSSPTITPPDDEDDFGDFEDASKIESIALPIKQAEVSRASIPDHSSARSLPPRASTTAVLKETRLPETSSRATHGVAPKSRSPPRPEVRSNPPKSLPFKPKPVAQDKPKTGGHPFAGHMDLLFSAGDDEYDAGADDLNVDLANDPEAAMAYSKKLIAAQMAKESGSRAPVPTPTSPKAQTKPPRSPNKLRKKSQYAPPKDHSLFFDAENVSDDEPQAVAQDDDDWGDFETVPAVKRGGHSKSAVISREQPQERAPPTMDLLSLDESPTTGDSSSNGRSQGASFIPTTTINETPDVDPWDDFESATPEPNPPQSDAALPVRNTAPPPSLPLPPANSSPPSNVPPPSLLLSLFPPLIASAQSTLLHPLSKLPPPDKETLLQHPANHTFLQTYLAHSVAMAHILAGRKLRWKRDQRLAQSMRIGPAGKQGGMKLAGVDKGELAKEEREVLDVLRLWGVHAGRLRSAVSAINASSIAANLPSVPEIAEAMPVKALKAAEGGFTAALTCALCGLKREERVAKVDEGIEDSFGEWWVDGAGMHVTCWKFWEEMKGKLKGR